MIARATLLLLTIPHSTANLCVAERIV